MIKSIDTLTTRRTIIPTVRRNLKMAADEASPLEVNAIFDTIRAGMSLPVKRWSVLAFLFACLALTSSIAIAAAEWQVIKVNGHDYLSVDNISKFYGLPAEVVPSGAKIQTETADHPLEFVSGSREAMIHGARSWLCFASIELNGKSLVARSQVRTVSRLRVAATCGQVVRWMRKVWRCPRAFIIRFLVISASTTVVSNAHGSRCCA